MTSNGGGGGSSTLVTGSENDWTGGSDQYIARDDSSSEFIPSSVNTSTSDDSELDDGQATFGATGVYKSDIVNDSPTFDQERHGKSTTGLSGTESDVEQEDDVHTSGSAGTATSDDSLDSGSEHVDLTGAGEEHDLMDMNMGATLTHLTLDGNNVVQAHEDLSETDDTTDDAVDGTVSTATIDTANSESDGDTYNEESDQTIKTHTTGGGTTTDTHQYDNLDVGGNDLSQGATSDDKTVVGVAQSEVTQSDDGGTSNDQYTAVNENDGSFVISTPSGGGMGSNLQLTTTTGSDTASGGSDSVGDTPAPASAGSNPVVDEADSESEGSDASNVTVVGTSASSAAYWGSSAGGTYFTFAAQSGSGTATGGETGEWQSSTDDTTTTTGPGTSNSELTTASDSGSEQDSTTDGATALQVAIFQGTGPAALTLIATDNATAGDTGQDQIGGGDVSGDSSTTDDPGTTAGSGSGGTISSSTSMANAGWDQATSSDTGSLTDTATLYAHQGGATENASDVSATSGSGQASEADDTTTSMVMSSGGTSGPSGTSSTSSDTSDDISASDGYSDHGTDHLVDHESGSSGTSPSISTTSDLDILLTTDLNGGDHFDENDAESSQPATGNSQPATSSKADSGATASYVSTARMDADASMNVNGPLMTYGTSSNDHERAGRAGGDVADDSSSESTPGAAGSGTSSGTAATTDTTIDDAADVYWDYTKHRDEAHGTGAGGSFNSRTDTSSQLTGSDSDAALDSTLNGVANSTSTFDDAQKYTSLNVLHSDSTSPVSGATNDETDWNKLSYAGVGVATNGVYDYAALSYSNVFHSHSHSHGTNLYGWWDSTTTSDNSITETGSGTTATLTTTAGTTTTTYSWNAYDGLTGGTWTTGPSTSTTTVSIAGGAWLQLAPGSASLPSSITVAGRLLVGGAAVLVNTFAAGARGGVNLTGEQLNKVDQVVANAVEKAVADMKASKWKPPVPEPGKQADPGAFGKEVHRRASEILAKKKGFYVDVYVDRATNKVLSIGEAPKGVDPKTYTQVDAIKTQQKLRVGKEIVAAKVEEVYDIKTGLGLDVPKNQAERLKAVKVGPGGDVKAARIKAVAPSERYKPSTGQWEAHPRYGDTGVRMLQLLGPVFAAWALTSSDLKAADIQGLAAAFAMAKGSSGELAGFVSIDVRNFLARFINDDQTVAWMLFAINRELQKAFKDGSLAR